MTVDVTVITPTLPGREEFLAEAVRSVEAQTVQPVDHRFLCDEPTPEERGPLHIARQRNRLLTRVGTPWVAVLDDDDLYLPHHFATIAPHLDGDADVIYTWPTERVVAHVDVTAWPSSMIASELQRGNVIPANACIRRAALEGVGGWSEDYDPESKRFNGTGATWEDWDLWIRLARSGSCFRCVPAPTWVYRVHDGQATHGTPAGVPAGG